MTGPGVCISCEQPIEGEVPGSRRVWLLLDRHGRRVTSERDADGARIDISAYGHLHVDCAIPRVEGLLQHADVRGAVL